MANSVHDVVESSPKGEKGWDLSFKEGKEGENRFRDVLLGQKVEVKSDHKAWVTGNVFIETSYKGSGSGITTTEAGFWAIEIRKGTFLVVPVERLRSLCEQARKIGKEVKGGDNNASLGLLIPVDWFWVY